MEEEINQEEEMEEVEVWEFSLDNEEIDELISSLQKLKENKGNFSFDIDEENELLVHHDEEEQ
tara:strand:- start:89 stop:277 length:189 start_codon:yes stop_codon:yes gene_type:complete